MELLKKNSKIIDISKFIIQKPETDNLLKIYELIKEFIKKEQNESYLSFKFNENLWDTYSYCKNLEILKLLRNIILECKKMDSNLNIENILLSQKIHEAGFFEIKNKTLSDKKLLEFLGQEETFYVEKQLNECQNKINCNAYEIDNLKKENEILNSNINNEDRKAENLRMEHSNLSIRIESQSSDLNGLSSSISNLKSDFRHLENKIKELERRERERRERERREQERRERERRGS